MPIVDIEAVRAPDRAGMPTADELADALGEVFGSPAGRTWVRMRRLDPGSYAENGMSLAESELPVFACVLHAHPPDGPARQQELAQLTRAIATLFGCAPDRVHVQYAAAGAGRQAFGGVLAT